MCGIFGVIAKQKYNDNDLRTLVHHSRQRGRDSSGILVYVNSEYSIFKSDKDIKKLVSQYDLSHSNVVLGHSRLITNGLSDNQPVVRDGMVLIHNGIIVNEEEIWQNIEVERKFEIDSEAILGVAIEYFRSNFSLDGLTEKILSLCKGTISCALVIPKLGKVLLISNNGSLYYGLKEQNFYFSSESYPLNRIECSSINQVINDHLIIDIPHSDDDLRVVEENVSNRINLIPSFSKNDREKGLLLYEKNESLKRCTKCILPSTMPFIEFDSKGVCNYCNNYKLANVPKPKSELFNLVEGYRRNIGAECIVPFSGGRDSCYALHLIVNELKMKPITYTYDWGMVTDLGRRNISRMCSELGVENIIVADDIVQKRNNIARNLKAWLKNPDLGMISILTAGDKHFFRHVETVKKQTGVGLNLWGINPLEVTHFKSGFLGIKPSFQNNSVYATGLAKQLDYHSRRFKAMLKSPGYFNSSLWDTVSGEFYRSFSSKTDYFEIFDYWRWDEEVVNSTLEKYNWELAADTNTTWRIGDGTAALYNYIYYLYAGFTEHDTFRSNQIREGQLNRDQALKLVEDENRPRYENIKWYLDTLGMDFEETISIINQNRFRQPLHINME